MKHAAITLFSLLTFIISNSQDKLPSFGKVDKADLELKDCSFDPGAEAMVLFDVGELEIRYLGSAGWQTETFYRVRVKVLKSSGVDRAQVAS